MSADWRSCSVVRDGKGRLRTDDGPIRGLVGDGLVSAESAAAYEHMLGPLTPVLDADGLPVVRTVGDLTALDALPVGSVVIEGSSGAPQSGPFGIPVMPGVFHRFPDGWHVVSGHGVGTPEFDLGPLTVLHTPCEVLP